MKSKVDAVDKIFDFCHNTLSRFEGFISSGIKVMDFESKKPAIIPTKPPKQIPICS